MAWGGCFGGVPFPELIGLLGEPGGSWQASICCFSGQWRVELGVAFGIFFVLNLCNRFVSCCINGARTSNPIWNLALFFFCEACTLWLGCVCFILHFTDCGVPKQKKALTQLVFFSFVGALRCAVILCGCEIYHILYFCIPKTAPQEATSPLIYDR